MADFEEATNDGEQEEEEEEEEQASPEEKLQIVQHLLLSSPPGEFDDVLSDAMALVPGDLVSRPMLAGIARAYNNANLRCARAADGTLVLLSERGELEPTLYAVPGSGAYRVDPRGTRSFAPLSTRGPFERRRPVPSRARRGTLARPKADEDGAAAAEPGRSGSAGDPRDRRPGAAQASTTSRSPRRPRPAAARRHRGPSRRSAMPSPPPSGPTSARATAPSASAARSTSPTTRPSSPSSSRASP